MLSLIQPLYVRDTHLLALQKAQHIKHPGDRLTLDQLAELVYKRQLWLFTFAGTDALIAVSFRQTAGGRRRLVIDGWTATGFGWHFRKAISLMQKLAADLRCDGVETLVWDRRLALAMNKSGVKPEAVSFYLPALED